MKRAMVSLATLALLAGMPAAWLMAQDQPAGQAQASPSYAGAPAAEQSATGATPLADPRFSGPVQGTYGAHPSGPCLGGPGCLHGGHGCLQGGHAGGPRPPKGVYVPGTFTAEAIFFNRQMNTSQTLAIEIPNFDEALNIQDIPLDLGTGTRFTTLLRPGGVDVEVVFFGIDNWARRRDLDAPGTAFFVPAISGVALYDPVTATYTSKLYNGEVNFRRQIYDSFAGFVGFRYTQLQENLTLIGTDAPNAQIGDTYADITNDLFGFQVGGDLSMGKGYSPFFIDLIGKAGVFTNQIHRVRSNFDPSTATTTYLSDYAARVAFIGQLGIRATYQLNSRLAAFGGYEVLFLSGVAMAPDHILANVATIDGSRTAFYHGATVGVELNW